MRKAWIQTGIGAGMGISILSVCAWIDLGLLAQLVFLIGLLFLVVGATNFLRRKEFVYGAIVLMLIASIFQLSILEWYGPHSVPGPTGFQSHRHTIWEMGHVH
jgi:uncharacterized membrane-anchored protein